MAPDTAGRLEMSIQGKTCFPALFVILVLAFVCVAVPPRSAPARSKANEKALPRLMKSEGFVAPPNFKAVVIKVKFDRTRNHVVARQAFDYNGTSTDRNWNAASSIKFFAAVGALNRVKALGFNIDARVTFDGEKPYSTTVRKLVEDAIIKSDNIAYDRLVQLAGFDRLHTRVLIPRYGISNTSLMKAYQQGDWTAMGQDNSLRVAPKITLKQGKKTKVIPASRGKAKRPCHSSVCTDLRDIAEGMATLLLQDQLGPKRSFDLAKRDYDALLRAMMEDRSRGNEAVDYLRKGLNNKKARFFSKPGYSEGWYSSVIYVYIKGKPAYIIAMAARPDREALNSAAQIIGKLIRKGRL